MPPVRTFPCPICGKDVPLKAKACPHCGACEKSGWNEEARVYDGLDLPEDSFNQEKLEEKKAARSRKWRGKELVWWITAAILLLVTFVLGTFNLLFQ